MMTKNIEKIDGIGVVVGRFQTPFLHKGHMKILDSANKHQKMLIVVGMHSIPGAYGEELDFETRRLMLSDKFPNAMILPLKNCPTDQEWSKNLDLLIYTVAPFSKATLYHGRDSFSSHYQGKHTLCEIDSILDVCASDIRKHAYQYVKNSDDFRSGVFYGLKNTFPRVNPTVDIAITRFNTEENVYELLLGRKDDGRGWRFPGGFVDCTDSCTEDAAVREAHEETGLYLENPEYICSRRVADWRNTERSVVMTFFYHFEYQMGHAKGDDDLAEVKWFSIDDEQLRNKTNLVKEHQPLLDEFFSFFNKKLEK